MTTPVRLGRYELLHSLAVGGMGEVFLARQRSIVEGFTRLVAVKVLLRSYCESPEFVAMFMEEARIAATLRHPCIVQVYDVGHEDGQYFMAMEYIPGQSLREILQLVRAPSAVTMPLRLVCELFADLASALATAHADGRGLIHRDVTPSNIMVSDAGTVKLIDFGVARAATRVSLTTPGVLKGKFGYMAPEYVKGHAYDHRSDLFSLGVVMFETIARRRLFRGRAAVEVINQLVTEPIPSLDTLDTGVSPALAALVARALEKDPAQRFASAEELALALELAAGELPPDPEFPTLRHWVDVVLADGIAARRVLEQDLLVLPPSDSLDVEIDVDGLEEPAGTRSRATLGERPARKRGSGSEPPPRGTAVGPIGLPGSGPSTSHLRGEQAAIPAVAPPASRRGRWVAGAIAVAIFGAMLALGARSFFAGSGTSGAVSSARPAASAGGGSAADAGSARPDDRADRARVHRVVGLEALEAGDYDLAVKEFTDAIRLGGARDDLGELLQIAQELRARSRETVAMDEATAGLVQPARAEPRSDEAPPRQASRGRRIVASRSRTPPPEKADTKTPSGVVIVTSTPSGQLVFVDGAPSDLTPARLTLPAGGHVIALAKGDTILHSQRVEVEAGGVITVYADVEAKLEQGSRDPPDPAQPAEKEPDPTRVPAKEPKATPATPRPVSPAKPVRDPVARGDVLVDSPNVIGEVWVDGVARGYAPIVVKNLPVGRVRVEIRVDGAVMRSKMVEIRPNVRTTVRFE